MALGTTAVARQWLSSDHVGNPTDTKATEKKCFCVVSFSRQKRCYIRTITARIHLKKSLVVGLKELDAKTN
jgi:hypothetical protein